MSVIRHFLKVKSICYLRFNLIIYFRNLEKHVFPYLPEVFAWMNVDISGFDCLESRDDSSNTLILLESWTLKSQSHILGRLLSIWRKE